MSINIEKKKNMTGEIFLAVCNNGTVQRVEACLKNGDDVNARSSERGRTVLQFAAMTCSAEVVRYLVTKGAKVNVTDDDGLTPMCMAVLKGRTDIIECLAALGADVDAKHDGSSLVHFAAMADIDERIERIESVTKTIECLAKLGADLNKPSKQGMTPLVQAALHGRIEAIKALVGQGVDVDQDVGMGMTPLFLAAGQGQVAVMQCLKDLGAKVNVKTNKGTTPLSLAEKEGQIEAVKWLRANGAR